MDYSQSFAISAIGMNIERTRVDVAALNLANANTVQGVGGVNFQPLRVIAESRAASVAATGSDESAAFGALVSQGLGAQDLAAGGAPFVQVVPTNAPLRLVYEPSHPLANDKGYVSYAAVDTATEMVSMMSATRAYEANVSAMNTTRMLALRALDIGSNA